jgi:hypothetical protein
MEKSKKALIKPYEKELKAYAKQIAKMTCAEINKIVPISVDGMPYSRQYVLEETIKILAASV